MVVGVTEMLSSRGCDPDAVAFDVLKEEAESGQHAIALRLEGPGIAAIGAAATFPEDMGCRRNDPSKGSLVSSAAIVGKV